MTYPPSDIGRAASPGKTLEVSVLLPVYNAAAYLEEAIRSVLTQSLGAFELIAVNDGSSDGSEAILRRLAAADRRIRVISRDNTGIVAHLNEALSAATAPLIARMDADDLCHPDRLRQQKAAFDADAGLALLGAAVEVIDPAGRPLMIQPRPLTHEAIVDRLRVGDGGAVVHPVLMARKEVLERIGGYLPRYQYAEDLDLYLRVAEVGRLANLQAPLLQYRFHSSSINAANAADQLHWKRQAVIEAAKAQSVTAGSDEA